MLIKNFIFIVVFTTICECYQNDIGVKGGSSQPIKSYGGYFHDSSGYSEAANDLTYENTYNRPIVSSYQPYGWNFNQPARTYGGVNVLQTPRYNFGSNYGWVNPGWNPRVSPSPAIPQTPSIFQPNFVPPVYFPGSYPYPSFNNYPNIFPQYNPGFGFHRPVYPTTGNDENVETEDRPAIANEGTSPGIQRPNIPNTSGGSNDLNQGEILPTGGSSTGSSALSGGWRGSSSSSSRGGGSSSTSGGGSGGGGSSSTSGGGSGGGGSSSNTSGGSSSGGSTTFSSSNFDSVNSASNQGGVYAFPQNPFYPPSTNRPIYNDYLPPYPTRRPTNIHPDQTAFETNNQRETQRPYVPIPGNQRPTTDFSRFPSSSLFTNNRRDWTDDDEMRWQATTKAPYFENKAPGLGCTLPAAAVLGAMSAMKVSSLLPLNVPSGKPILSCNATELLQAQINLNGKVYDCKDSSITVSCSTYGSAVNECREETLECDVNMRQMDAYSVTCTNGTLISNSHIVCESAMLMINKNILNCYFKDAVKVPKTSAKIPVSVIPLQTPAPVNEDFEENSLENRREIAGEESELMPQVKKAMRNVFPHELLAMPSTMYLPQKRSMPPKISAELKNHVNGVFKANLLASSQTEESDSLLDVRANTDSTSLSQTDAERISENWRDQTQSRWEFNSDVKNAPAGTKTKITQRLGGVETREDLRDRLIFTD